MVGAGASHAPFLRRELPHVEYEPTRMANGLDLTFRFLYARAVRHGRPPERRPEEDVSTNRGVLGAASRRLAPAGRMPGPTNQTARGRDRRRHRRRLGCRRPALRRPDCPPAGTVVPCVGEAHDGTSCLARRPTRLSLVSVRDRSDSTLEMSARNTNVRSHPWAACRVDRETLVPGDPRSVERPGAGGPSCPTPGFSARHRALVGVLGRGLRCAPDPWRARDKPVAAPRPDTRSRPVEASPGPVASGPPVRVELARVVRFVRGPAPQLPTAVARSTTSAPYISSSSSCWSGRCS
jgi:hypothetical protein